MRIQISRQKRFSQALPESRSHKLDGARTPLSDLPLAGYGARKGAPALGMLDEVHVRVLWLQDDHRVPSSSMDMLIPPPEMIATFRKVQRGGIPSEAVYWCFAHSFRPGGMGSGWLLRLSPALPARPDHGS